MQEFLVKILIVFIFEIIIAGTGVYAVTILYASSDVVYDNTSSGLTSTNVQDAIDELYTKVYLVNIGNYIRLTLNKTIYTTKSV